MKSSAQKLKLTAIFSSLSLALVACGEDTAPDPGPVMGNATPAESPQEVQPDGQVVPFEEVLDVDVTGDTLGVRTADSLHIGSLEQITSNAARQIPLDSSCTDVTANANTFVVTCGDTIHTISPNSEDSVIAEAPMESAVITTTGEIITASSETNRAWVYDDGELIDDFPVQDPTDELVAVAHRDGQPDSVVRINRENTTIQDIDWESGRGGGTLRVGVGVGTIAPGEDGLVLASDTLGPQIAVYTTGEVVRLHQTAPVADSPWAVFWDTNRQLAWAVSTGTNTACGYDISQGVPLQRAEVRTVPDAKSAVALPDGTLVLGSATGAGIQVVASDQVETKELN